MNPAYKPWVNLAVATLVSAATAVGGNVVLAQLLAVDEAPSAERSASAVLADAVAGLPAIPDVALTREAYVTAILKRNIFDHTQIGVDVPDAVSTDNPDGPKLSELNVRLTGTVVTDPPEYSAAFIAEDKAASSPRAYALGQLVLGAEVVQIMERKVKLRRNNEYEWLLLDEDVEVKPKADDGAPAPDDIEQADENEFVVPRAMLDEALSDLDGLARMGRALLHRGPDGEFDGYRLSAIRRGTLADKLGIKNGDIIHAVNGLPLTSVQGAMTALQSLQSENALKFQVTRRGQSVDLNYDIR